MTEEPLPRLYGDFELARLICANETGRIYRGFFRASARRTCACSAASTPATRRRCRRCAPISRPTA
ncbi:hypothetical protein [Nannocystis pusilla]|uniref:hypothetical protein n=1 Tax=Nannocystis pusilla TaxID=889268 RepID=UPI003B7A766E